MIFFADGHSNYYHALKVWTSFECENLCVHMNIYLLKIILLLGDVFENFWETSHNTCKMSTNYKCPNPREFQVLPWYFMKFSLKILRCKTLVFNINKRYIGVKLQLILKNYKNIYYIHTQHARLMLFLFLLDGQFRYANKIR